MSNSLFWKQQTEAFTKAHPKKMGWKVYECSDRAQSELGISFLPDFLRDHHPAAIKQRALHKEIRTDDLLGKPKKSHPIEPGSEWDINKELDIYDWIGLLEIQWKGQPIHYLRFKVIREHSYNDYITIVAAKSNAVLRDFHAALEQYAKNRLNEFRDIMVINGHDLPMPSITWDDVILPQGMAEDIRHNIETFFLDETRKRYKKLGIPYRRGFIFVGPPGGGKTLVLKAIANTAPARFIVLQVSAKIEERDIERAFAMAARCQPAILVFEDLERLIESKEIGVSYFLNMLDGFKILDGILVIATSNNPEKLDPALLHRPSRFDRVWRFPLPKLQQRHALLAKKGDGLFSPEALAKVAQESEGFSMTYTQEIIVTALLESIRNGGEPKDEHLFQSLYALKNQRKAASKDLESLATRESIGFAMPTNGAEQHPSFSETL